MTAAVAVGGRSGRRGGGRVRRMEKLRDGVEEIEEEKEEIEDEEEKRGRGVVRRSGGRGAFVEMSSTVELVDVDVVASVIVAQSSSSSSKRRGPYAFVFSSSNPKTRLMQLSVIGG